MSDIDKKIKELALLIFEDFIAKDGKMTLDEVKKYRELREFADMMFDISFKENSVDYIRKRLEYLRKDV